MNKSLIPFLLLLLLGCKSPVESVYNTLDYFPLQIGNKWYYNTIPSHPDSIDLVWTVTGLKLINGNLYYSIVENSSSFAYIDTVYYRFQGTSLLNQRFDTEQYLADFSLNLNQYAPWRDDLKVIQKSDDIMKFETPFGADYGYSITFKKGIGITHTIDNGIIYNYKTLIKAELK